MWNNKKRETAYRQRASDVSMTGRADDTFTFAKPARCGTDARGSSGKDGGLRALFANLSMDEDLAVRAGFRRGATIAPVGQPAGIAGGTVGVLHEGGGSVLPGGQRWPCRVPRGGTGGVGSVPCQERIVERTWAALGQTQSAALHSIREPGLDGRNTPLHSAGTARISDTPGVHDAASAWSRGTDMLPNYTRRTSSLGGGCMEDGSGTVLGLGGSYRLVAMGEALGTITSGSSSTACTHELVRRDGGPKEVPSAPHFGSGRARPERQQRGGGELPRGRSDRSQCVCVCVPTSCACGFASRLLFVFAVGRRYLSSS